jgi:hypothetical protein
VGRLFRVHKSVHKSLVFCMDGRLLPSRTTKPVRRNGMAMTFNNGGDEIVLFDAEHVERDRFKYETSTEGVVISTNH